MSWASAVLLALTLLVVAANAVLVFRKALRHPRSRRAARRRARLVELVGELAVRTDEVPLNRELGNDPLFREVVLEYLRLLRGDERQRLLDLARRLGVIRHFRRETRSGNKGVRAQAVEALSEIADPATVPDLVGLLGDPVREVRVQAVAALAVIGDTRVLPGVLSVLDRSEDWAAQRISDALLRFGSGAVPSLSDYLSGPGKYQPLVARTLGLIGDPAAEPALLQVLDSPDQDLRLRAAAALGRCGSGQSVRPLIESLHDPSWEVRAQAATALGRRMEPAAIPGLSYALSDEFWWVRHNAAAALGGIPDGVDALRRALQSDDSYARDAAAAVLLETGTAEAATRAIRSEDPLEREEARDLIGHLLDAGKVEYFLSLGISAEDLAELRSRREG